VNEYEFTAADNVVIGRLALTAFVAGALSIVSGLLVVALAGWWLSAGDLAARVSALVIGASGALAVLFGAWLVKAASLFRRIVTTAGSDVALLMGAFRELAKIYKTQFWIWVGCFGLSVVSIIASLILRHAH
jgi:hypothetical protein